MFCVTATDFESRLRFHLVHLMWITTAMVIFIIKNKMCCNGIIKFIH